MNVRSNRLGDIRSYYRQKLMTHFTEREADSLLFMILMEYTGFSKAQLLIRHQDAVSESQLLKIHFAVDALLKDKPIQYILGHTEFFGLPFIVNSWVLIPRPETEELVDAVIGEYRDHPAFCMMDIGTGSGNIAVAVKKNIPQAEVYAVDVSEFALEVAKSNADLNHAEISFSRLDLLDQETWRKVPDFDLIVSNPPYVRNQEKRQMKRNVLDYEPGSALFVPDDDPLIYYQGILSFCSRYLKSGGAVYCEINQYLAEEVLHLFRTDGYIGCSILNDVNGNARIFKGST